MKIKRFFAKDMRTAMVEVKEVLGPDAVIMSNKKVVGGIEIVAAVDYQAQQAETSNKKEDSLAGLQDDNVQLSSRANKAPIKAQRSHRNGAKESGEDFAKSLNSFFGKVETQQAKNRAKKSNTVTQKSRDELPAFSALSEQAAKTNRPRTLAEQQNWTSNEQPVKVNAGIRRNAPVASRNDNQDIAKISEEVASLRKLLEHQVSGLMWQEMERKEPIRAMVIKWLSKAGFSDDIADQLASYIPEDASSTEVQQYIQALLQDKIYIGKNEILSQGGAIALLGPTGVGKTTTIAKLAAQFAMKYGAEQVALITTDTYRIGAHEQLATYGKIMGCSVRVAKDADELSEILYQFREKRLVLIDTAGMGQRDIRLSEQLDTLMRNSRVDIQSYLVVSSTAQRRVVEEAIDHFKRIPLSGCILTKVDESIGLGELLSVTIQHALPISYITTGQRVPEDIEIASIDNLISGTLNMMNKIFEQELHQWFSNFENE
ncbi:flagellar biosynthesis protein FlhF [Psychromonas sp. Urea-02u-13]|uniref:flagellar biosynthesis protein FlhF n=1 Tax=Psychromonas sp. Urea-02u-13 TaxID=2058326 RepID=UPI000C31EC11|nr:flagellar biosynthesis protein FlhF [Psychromonas sp. Urea-02u-13]PKG39862.1 flagellar biosynthesis protein FlhF [Psychromonas sp. Urea-02u-13]